MRATLKLTGGPLDGQEIKEWVVAPYFLRTIKIRDGASKEHCYFVSKFVKDDNGNVQEAIGEYTGYSVWFFVSANEAKTHEIRLVPKEPKPDDLQPAPKPDDPAVP